MHENMQHNIIENNGTNLIESDKPHRPDSLASINSEKPYMLELLTRVEVQNVHQDTPYARKVPVTIPDVVDSEDVTLQDGCAKGSGNHSGYWKSVVSFGIGSVDLIVPVDDEHIKRKTSRSNKRRRTRQKRIYKIKQQNKFTSFEQILLAVQPYLVPLHGRLPPHDILSPPTGYRFTLSTASHHGL